MPRFQDAEYSPQEIYSCITATYAEVDKGHEERLHSSMERRLDQFARQAAVNEGLAEERLLESGQCMDILRNLMYEE